MLSKIEESVFHHVQHKPLHLDEIQEQCTAESGRVSPVLLQLEMKKLVKQLPGKYFVLNSALN